MNSVQLLTSASAAIILGFTLNANVSASTVTVYANNAAPGDASTVAQALGASGWLYNNVRDGGTVGINTSNARSGNASVAMSGTTGPGGNSSKGDIEFYASLGSFANFEGMSFDWYRDSSSTNESSQHPSLRILLDINGNEAGGFGSLIFERVYNGGLVAPADSWQHEVIGADTNLWNTGLGLGFAYDLDGLLGYAYDSTLADWKASPLLARAQIVGFSSGFGSGWGPFSGAVDNISWTIGGVTTTTNFEVQRSAVPEPGTLVLVGLSLAGLAALRRRSR